MQPQTAAAGTARQPRVPALTDQLEKQLVCHQELLQTLAHKLEAIRVPKPSAVAEKDRNENVDDPAQHIAHLEQLSRMVDDQSAFVTRLIEEVEL